jgi:hypothetical protein
MAAQLGGRGRQMGDLVRDLHPAVAGPVGSGGLQKLIGQLESHKLEAAQG